MPNKTYWSSNVGHILGVPLRVHFLLVLFCILIFAIEFNARGGGYLVAPGTALATVALLLLSLLIHELAHVLSVRDVGGTVGEIVLVPWGGLSEFTLPNSNSKRGFVAMSGALVNGLIFFLGAYLLIVSGKASLWQLVNPMRPFEFDYSETVISSVKVMTWINFQLFFLNLIPCYPFDGAQLLRAVISGVAGKSSKNRMESAVMVFGQGFAFGLIGLAAFTKSSDWGFVNSGWIVLLVGGLTLIYTTKYSYQFQIALQDEDWPDDSPDLEPYCEDRKHPITHPSFDYSDDSSNSVYSNWLREKEEERLIQLALSEDEENRRMDSILEKLHVSGIQSLNEDEKEILDRVSARLRRQRQQGV